MGQIGPQRKTFRSFKIRGQEWQFILENDFQMTLKRPSMSNSRSPSGSSPGPQ